MSNIKFNSNFERDLEEQLRANLLPIDKDLRARFTGHPASEVAPAAKSAFAEAGLDLGDGLQTYAESVEKNESFEFQFHL